MEPKMNLMASEPVPILNSHLARATDRVFLNQPGSASPFSAIQNNLDQHRTTQLHTATALCVIVIALAPRPWSRADTAGKACRSNSYCTQQIDSHCANAV
jgi:hypothetical protein